MKLTVNVPVADGFTLSMSSSPRLDAVELVLIVAEAGLYGIFLVILIGALEALYERRRRGESCILLLSVSVCLFCSITSHLILDVAHVFDGFIRLQNAVNPPSGPSSATLFFEDLSNRKYVASSCFYVVTTCVGDAFMIYRLYIVWGRNFWIIIPPSVIQAGLSATGGVIQWLVAAKSDGSIFQTVGGWITAWFVLTFCTNLYCTVLIAYKVWQSKRSVTRLGRAQQSPVQRVVNALIQSAALYRQSNVQYVLAATNCPTVGIAFTMIAARTGRLGQGTDTESESRRTFRDAIAMRPVAIKITTSTQVDHPPASADYDASGKPESEFEEGESHSLDK
ncbi:hypothetical protein NM688_g1591 [Phlebia brevispora]|uniref:Uncharacterized protein n=1 Tax=Phlebia brevispora TaxID=194682 RepID=A0ACC1TB62_9APHY|nr:hypothetical protein NM688_g1591 [Phlebia brevispora]